MKKVHFIGIGGIGLSAIAKFLKEKGYEISGSDISESSKILEQEGFKIIVPHDENSVINKDLIIYSAAIKEDNEELIKAKELGIKCLSRKEALKLVLEDKKVFAVAGAHGKSTTSAMLANLINGSAIIGAISKEFNSNMRYEKSENLIFEADESDSSFLNANPHIAIVTNAEPEHMEHYNYDLDKFYSAYKGFLQRAKIRIINAEDDFLSTLNLDSIKLYPSKDIKNIKTTIKNFKPYTRFELKNLGSFEVFGIGEHIALDASLAILAAMQEISIQEIKKNLLDYKGIKKRFDILCIEKNFILIDDYGHHPTEIKATLKAAYEYSKLLNLNSLKVIFQPHKYSRLQSNLKAFVDCFENFVDELIILPVYSAGENKIDLDLKQIFAKYKPILTEKITRNKKSISFIDESKKERILDNGLIIGFGAGDISKQLRGNYD